jgi:hypothetical protein
MKRDIKIVSGGQTGVDRAALDLALELGIPCGGWCPKGRLAEDGVIDEKFPLKETVLEDVDQRTEWNARDSDGTLIITIGEPKDGTVWTYECLKKYEKPYLSLSLDSEVEDDELLKWSAEHNVATLNIAGPRESHMPGVIYSQSYMMLKMLLSPFL